MTLPLTPARRWGWKRSREASGPRPAATPRSDRPPVGPPDGEARAPLADGPTGGLSDRGVAAGRGPLASLDLFQPHLRAGVSGGAIDATSAEGFPGGHCAGAGVGGCSVRDRLSAFHR